MSTRHDLFALFVSLALAAGCASGGGGDSATPTPTSSPTPTPSGTLGCRTFQVSSGADGTAAGNSYYQSTIIGGDLSEFLGATGWAPASFSLCAGSVSGGKAPLTLSSDATLAISLPQNNCICRQYVAAGTTGSLFCGATGDSKDFTVSWDSMGATVSTATPVLADGTAAAGDGDARLVFKSRETNIGTACTVSNCATALAGLPLVDLPYTTGTATSSIQNPVQGGGTKSTSLTGHAFDGCAAWSSGTVKGGLAGAPEHEEDNTDLGTNDVATVERVSEQ